MVRAECSGRACISRCAIQRISCPGAAGQRKYRGSGDSEEAADAAQKPRRGSKGNGRTGAEQLVQAYSGSLLGPRRIMEAAASRLHKPSRVALRGIDGVRHRAAPGGGGGGVAMPHAANIPGQLAATGPAPVRGTAARAAAWSGRGRGGRACACGDKKGGGGCHDGGEDAVNAHGGKARRLGEGDERTAPERCERSLRQLTWAVGNAPVRKNILPSLSQQPGADAIYIQKSQI